MAHTKGIRSPAAELEPGALDLSRIMVENNIGKIERYPGGWFTVSHMDGTHGRGRSVGEAYRNLTEGIAA